MFFYLLICLIISLVTIDILIVKHFHSYNHRLLPLILGLISVYDFYMLVEYLYGAQDIFTMLKDLLLIQMLDLILYYILDFTNSRLKWWQDVMVVTVLLIMDVIIFSQADDPGRYFFLLRAFTTFTMVIVMYAAYRAAFDNKFSPSTKKNNAFLMLALMISLTTYILSSFKVVKESIAMPLALAVTDIIVAALVLSDRMRDVRNILEEELFQTLDVPSILFDSDFFFLDSSMKANKLLGKQIEILRENPDNPMTKKRVLDLLGGKNETEVYFKNEYYRVNLQEAYYNGNMKGYIMTLVNITSQKKEALVAKEVAKQKGEFLANISHDLRSPLHAIIGGSEIVLGKRNIPLNSRVMINHINDAGHNLLDMVNSILDFSKLESGNLTLNPSKYDLRKLIQEQAHICYVNLKDKPVDFEIEIASSFPEEMIGDELRVRQIIQNILSNAIKFTNEGHVKACFEFEIEDTDVKVIYTVEDTGSGINPNQLDAVFGDYVSYASNQKKEGTGLGLSIVSKLAKMMGGSAKAYSDGVSGSRFEVIFHQELASPLQDEYSGLCDPFTITDNDSLDEISDINKVPVPNFVYPRARVLMADDMSVNREIFARMVEPWEFSLDVVEDGKDAVEMVNRNSYDLIFLDQMMTVMNGTEASDLIAKITDAPRILVTADITENMKEDAIKHGFITILQKPIDEVELQKAIETYIPEYLRDNVDILSIRERSVNYDNKESYRKTLNTYIEELRELLITLPEYMAEDLDMFRNKVHGIKGTSLQLGKIDISNAAEIMEMAAKCNNTAYIEKNFDSFIKDIEITIGYCVKELESIKTTSFEPVNKITVSDVELKGILQELKDGLESYDMQIVDEVLNRIDECALDEATEELIGRIKALYEDMEYEDAASKLSAYI